MHDRPIPPRTSQRLATPPSCDDDSQACRVGGCRPCTADPREVLQLGCRPSAGTQRRGPGPDPAPLANLQNAILEGSRHVFDPSCLSHLRRPSERVKSTQGEWLRRCIGHSADRTPQQDDCLQAQSRASITMIKQNSILRPSPGQSNVLMGLESCISAFLTHESYLPTTHRHRYHPEVAA
jgi:hypothetical protein